MAFSFGTATPASTPAFGFGASTPAFGAAASTPAATSNPSFGFGTAPAFGAPQPSPGFGAVSTPAFGAPASAPSLFGAKPASSTPAFGAAQATPSLFGTASAPSLFGAQQNPATASTPGFGFGTGALALTSTAPSLFGTPQQQPQQHQQQSALATRDGRPLTHTTKWDDLSPQAQQYLLELEKKVVQFREECRQLDGDERLSRGRDTRSGIEDGARLLSQSITSLGTSLRGDSGTCEAIGELVRRLLRNTETALYTFKRSYMWREGIKSTQGQALPSYLMEQLSGPVVLPSHYLRDAVAGFQENLEQYKACCAELEQVVSQQHDAGRLLGVSSSGSPTDLLQSLQAALTNLHDLLIHTAAKLQAADDRVVQAKEAHLASRRQAGDYSDPFAEAERQQQNRANGSRQNNNGSVAGRQGAGQSTAPATATPPTQQQAAQPTGTPGFGGGAAAFGATSPALAPAPSGLFGTLSPAATPTPFGGGGTFGTALFGGAATSATVRKAKSKK